MTIMMGISSCDDERCTRYMIKSTKTNDSIVFIVTGDDLVTWIHEFKEIIYVSYKINYILYHIYIHRGNIIDN